MDASNQHIKLIPYIIPPKKEILKNSPLSQGVEETQPHAGGQDSAIISENERLRRENQQIRDQLERHLGEFGEVLPAYEPEL